MVSEIKNAQTVEAGDFLKFINSSPTKHDEFRVQLLGILPLALPYINITAIDRTALKGLHMV